MSAQPVRFATALPPLPDPVAELKSLLQQIPFGRVTTYGQIAAALGSRHAAKWVAYWLLSESAAQQLPWHRVVRTDGSLGEYRGRSSDEHAQALGAEGIPVSTAGVDLDRFGFDGFASSAPLKYLAEWQLTLATQITLRTSPELQQFVTEATQAGPTSQAATYYVGGVDVSYVTPSRAVAAYVLVDLHSGELVWSMTREHDIDFPYISGFLALRELPAVLPLLDDVRDAGKLARIILVDGHGTLHPRRMGIASHLGVITGLATIGVGKTISLGSVDLNGISPGEARPIVHERQIVGTALRPAGGQKPVFFSPGHLLDLQTANTVVGRLSQQYRLPTPTYWADRLSREAARK